MVRKRLMTAHALIVACAIAYHVGVLAWEASADAPNFDELGHLSAGLAVWKLNRFDLYSVNPPLVKSIAALPALLSGVKTPWFSFRSGPGVRSEAAVGVDLLIENGDKTFRYLTWGRWALIPLSLLGAFICYRWASELYGAAAGLAAFVLWCTSPTVATWASTINPDAGAAALGVTFGYCFWRWHRSPTIKAALVAGCLLGLAGLTKFSWLVVFPLIPVLAVLPLSNSVSLRDVGRRTGHVLVVLLTALYLMNLGYLFQGSLRPLKDHVFVSHFFGGSDAVDPEHRLQGNRFRGTWMGEIPVPLPAAYITGIDLQKRDFEGRRWCYLNGQWKHGGWWYFYIVASVWKEPLGVLFLAVGRLLAIPWTLTKRGWVDGLLLVSPAVAIFALVSSQTGFTIYLRYILPCHPFLFIWVSRLFRDRETATRWRSSTAWVLCAWAALSSAAVLPHSHSYFNALAGGPLEGHRRLVDANIDWGEDVWYLKEWYDNHPEARPLLCLTRAVVDLEHFGIESSHPPKGPDRGFDLASRTDEQIQRLGPHPGWYAISVHHIHDLGGGYEYFLQFDPVTMAGYSIYIYHITPQEANRVRKELGLPPLVD